MLHHIIFMASLFVCFHFAKGLDNGVGGVPPLGYNTWNDFGCANISAVNVRLVADRMVQMGFIQVGYMYLNIDDCWAIGRDKVTRQLIPDPVAFPDGMKIVADYVHSKGLKLGIYTDRGYLTCAKRPGSKGHEMLDAQTFADWGIDFLKEDSCFNPEIDHDVALREYALMRDALNATGRQIFFSLCGWRRYYGPPGMSLGNSWRITQDVRTWSGVYQSVQTANALHKFSGPGGFNDPDMLLGSTPGTFFSLTKAQSRSQFSLWCAMMSPLLVGASMLRMSSFDLETYTNSEAIAVSQDPLAVQGSVIWGDCPRVSLMHKTPECGQVLSKPLSSGGFALVLVNYSPKPRTVACEGTCMDLACGGRCTGQQFIVRDVWAKKNVGVLSTVQVTLEGGASAMFVLTGTPVGAALVRAA